MSGQARWPHAPNAPHSSIPLSMPSHQQEGVQTSQLSPGPSADQAINVNVRRFTGSRTSTSSDGDKNFPRAAEVNVLPKELELVDTSNSTTTKTSVQGVVSHTPSMLTISDAVKVDVQNGNSSSNGNKQNVGSSYKTQHSQQSVSTQQYANYQRGGSVSQRNSSGNEWSHRRYQGRNQSAVGAEKSFSSSKVKQIYVAKQAINGSSTLS